MRSVKKTWEKTKTILGTETGVIVLLLSVGAFFYSLLLKENFAQENFIGLLCNDWKDIRLVHHQICYDSQNSLLSLNNKADVLSEHIKLNRDDVSLLKYYPGNVSDRNLCRFHQQMGDAAVCPTILPSVIVVAFKETIPLDVPGEFVLCELPDCDELRTNLVVLLSELEAYAKKHEDYIRRPLQDFKQTLQAHRDNSWLYATAYLLSKLCPNLDEGAALYDELSSSLTLALQKSNALKDTNYLSNMFLDSLNQYIGNHAEKVRARGDTHSLNDQEPHQLILYDRTRCYISDETFCEICKKLEESASAQQINRALNYDGIQIPEKLGEHWKNTQSIPFCKGGVQKRARYHVLSVTDAACPNLRKSFDSVGIEEVREDEY